MRPSIFFITLTVCLLHLQLTQSDSREENNGPLVQKSCTRSSFLKDYLQHKLRFSHYPENILVLTDCISNFDIQDYGSVSFSSLAVVNITTLENVTSNIFHKTKPFIVLDLPENLIEYAINKIYGDFKLNRMIIKWQPMITIIWNSIEPAYIHYNLMHKVFKATPFYFDTTLFVFFLEPFVGRITVWEVYDIKLRRVYKAVTSFSTSNLATGGNGTFQLSTLYEDLESFAKRRRNFHLESLTISVKFDPKFQDWTGVGIREESTYYLTGGYVAILYWDLKLLMNFSDHILIGDSPQTYPNGTIGGTTVRQLLSGEIDLTLNQISFSPQRAKVLTFLQPTYHSLTHVFFKQPSTNSMRVIVIAAFQKELWIALIGVWAILVISTKVRLTSPFKNVSSQYISARRDDQKFANESLLWSVAAFCQKTWHLDPTSFSLRMKFMIGSILGFLLYTVYSGSIVSSLAVNKIPVKNFFDLINFNFLFTVHENSEPFQTMLKGMIKSFELTQDVKTTSTAKEVSHLFVGSSTSSIQSAKVAFLSPADMFYKTAEVLNYTDSFICAHVSSFNTGTYPSKSAMLVKKASQFKEVLNYMLVYIRQRGLLHRNMETYNTKNFLRCIPMDEQDSKVEPVKWMDVFTIFLILFIGILSAIVLLSLEILYTCYCDWKARSIYKTILLDYTHNNYIETVNVFYYRA